MSVAARYTHARNNLNAALAAADAIPSRTTKGYSVAEAADIKARRAAGNLPLTARAEALTAARDTLQACLVEGLDAKTDGARGWSLDEALKKAGEKIPQLGLEILCESAFASGVLESEQRPAAYRSGKA